MELFEWNPNYGTGITEIDTQHAYLFALTNRLIRYTSAGGEIISASDIIDELQDYAERHFSYEESIMEQARYEHLAEHKVQHDRMRSRLQLYAAEIKSGGLAPGELTDFLKTWLKMHILREDMKYISAVAHLKDGS